MIRNRHVFVVQEQRVIGAKDSSDVGGVVDRGIKIRVVANRHRKEQFGLIHRHEKIRIAASPLRIEILMSRARSCPIAAAPRAINGFSTCADTACGSSPAMPSNGKLATTCEIEDLISNGHPDSHGFLAVASAKHLRTADSGWENPFRSGGRLYPTSQSWIVGVINRTHGFVYSISRNRSRSSTGSENAQDPNDRKKLRRASARSAVRSVQSRQTRPPEVKAKALADPSRSASVPSHRAHPVEPALRPRRY